MQYSEIVFPKQTRSRFCLAGAGQSSQVRFEIRDSTLWKGREFARVIGELAR